MTNVIDLNSHRAQPTAGRATYTVAEVGHMLGISRASTYVLLKTGEIPARRLGSRWIIPRLRFHEWLDTMPLGAATTTGVTR